MINTGTKAAVADQLHPLHRPTFCSGDKEPHPVKMHGATSKDTLMTPVAKGHLQIPAIVLPGWTKVECQDLLLKATGRKSDCTGLAVDELFDKHLDHLQQALKKDQMRSKKHFDTDTRKVMVTCHHKRNHQKDPVITGLLILGAACLHLLTPLAIPKDCPLSAGQMLINQAKVRDLIFTRQCDEATLNVIHHCQEEHPRFPRDEPHNLSANDRNFPCCEILS